MRKFNVGFGFHIEPQYGHWKIDLENKEYNVTNCTYNQSCEMDANVGFMCSEVFSKALKTNQSIRIRLIATNKTHFINKRIKFVYTNSMIKDVPVNYILKTDFVTIRTDVHKKIDLFLGKIIGNIYDYA